MAKQPDSREQSSAQPKRPTYQDLADEFDIPFLGQIPIVQTIREGGDTGIPVMAGNDEITKKAFEDFAGAAARGIAMRNANFDATEIQEILPHPHSSQGEMQQA